MKLPGALIWVAIILSIGGCMSVAIHDYDRSEIEGYVTRSNFFNNCLGLCMEDLKGQDMITADKIVLCDIECTKVINGTNTPGVNNKDESDKRN